ncbi:hypothetical protein B5N75_22340 [Salmonella enterica]|uniref:Uncharacterized protein n=2 Tax=Salmonella enterica TaxID=28901 RepID=A0A7Z1PCL4_SALET|nr:hypothetical protein [Salmonella enterica]EAB9741762.1 hypothetical protein [Salmonella enterica subsp. diarizonae]PTU34036.1 hypothetical protein DBZ43_25970 [Salmonella enterica subsp. enterica]EAA9928661.1 hypothetical protein [Salmonella enterica]EAO9251234.1 hypothetical protein [Salmonella enterica]
MHLLSGAFRRISLSEKTLYEKKQPSRFNTRNIIFYAVDDALSYKKKAANEAAQRQKLQWFIIFNDLCFPYPE